MNCDKQFFFVSNNQFPFVEAMAWYSACSSPVRSCVRSFRGSFEANSQWPVVEESRNSWHPCLVFRTRSWWWYLRTESQMTDSLSRDSSWTVFNLAYRCSGFTFRMLASTLKLPWKQRFPAHVNKFDSNEMWTNYEWSRDSYHVSDRDYSVCYNCRNRSHGTAAQQFLVKCNMHNQKFGLKKNLVLHPGLSSTSCWLCSDEPWKGNRGNVF